MAVKPKIKKALPFFVRKYRILRDGDRAWVVIWLLIFSSFILLDLLFPHLVFQSTVVKYAGIFLCVIYTWAKFGNDTLLCLAILMTLLSDTILMFLDAKTFGVFTFCFAQLFHALRLSGTPSRYILTYFVAVFMIFTFGVLQDIPPLYVLAFIYASNFVINIYLSWKWHRQEPSNLNASCCFWGMLLFIMCDICVGVGYLGSQGVVPAAIASLVSFFIFIFYYPSQVLLSNSSNLVDHAH